MDGVLAGFTYLAFCLPYYYNYDIIYIYMFNYTVSC